MFIFRFTAMLLVISLLPAALASEFYDILRDPALSSNCKHLLKNRSEKLNYKHRLQTTLNRNKRLQTQVRDRKLPVESELKRGQSKIQRQLNLTLIRLKNMDEEIIRSGCPGIAL